MFYSDEKCFYEPTNAYGSIYNSLLISSYDKGVKKGSMEAANLWLVGLSERVSNDFSLFLSCFQGQGKVLELGLRIGRSVEARKRI